MTENPKHPGSEERPLDLEGVPDEEDISPADAADRADSSPDEQLNRPDQPGYSESERAPFVEDRDEDPDPRDGPSSP